MSIFQQKIACHARKKKKTKNIGWREKQSLELELHMSQMLELLGREFKISMINRLSTLMKKVDSIQKQMNNTSRRMETIRENGKQILEIKNSLPEMLSMGSSTDSTYSWKELITLKICQ